MPDDINGWNYQPASRENTRWTVVLERNNSKWNIVEMQFSFAVQKETKQIVKTHD